MFAVTHSGGVLRDGRPLTCQEGAHKRENIHYLVLLSLNMLLFLLGCTLGVLCFVVVALLVSVALFMFVHTAMFVFKTPTLVAHR